MLTQDEIKVIRDKRQSLLDSADALIKRTKEAGNKMTAEDKAAFDAALGEADELRAFMDRISAADNLRAHMAAPASAAALQDPNHQSIIVGDDRSAKAPGAFGRYLQAVARSARGMATIDDQKEIQKRAVYGGAETPPAIGGFLVDKPQADMIIDVAWATGVLPSRCFNMPITVGNGTRIPCVDVSNLADGYRPVRGYWIQEGGSITASNVKFGEQTIDLKDLAILAPVTNRLLEDAPALEAFITRKAGEEIGYLMDRAIYRGTGAGTPLGALNAPCLVSAAAEVGQDADTINGWNIVKMVKRTIPEITNQYVWLYNQECYDQIILLEHPTTNQLLFTPAGGISQKPYETILGRPAFGFSHCSALGDLGDIMLCYWNDYLLADKGGIQADTSIHLYFDTAQTAFRFIFRADGQPMLPSAITPEYATSNTISTFVALAAR